MYQFVNFDSHDHHTPHCGGQSALYLQPINHWGVESRMAGPGQNASHGEIPFAPLSHTWGEGDNVGPSKPSPNLLKGMINFT